MINIATARSVSPDELLVELDAHIEEQAEEVERLFEEYTLAKGEQAGLVIARELAAKAIAASDPIVVSVGQVPIHG